MTRINRRTRLATVAVLVPLALGLAACGGDDDRSTPTATETVTADPSASSSETPTADGSAAAGDGDLETAAQTALGEIDGTVFSVDLDDQGWDVSIVSANGEENDVDLGADATTVIRGPVVDTSDDNDDAAERERLLGASLDYLAAIEAAAGQAQGAVTGVDLSEENGTAIWEVQFDEDTATAMTVEVDAQTGEVLRTEQDD